VKVTADASCTYCGSDVEIETDHPPLPGFAWRAYQDDVGVCVDCGLRHVVALSLDREGVAELLDEPEDDDEIPCCESCGVVLGLDDVGFCGACWETAWISLPDGWGP
jgi:hypothetical protein